MLSNPNFFRLDREGRDTKIYATVIFTLETREMVGICTFTRRYRTSLLVTRRYILAKKVSADEAEK